MPKIGTLDRLTSEQRDQVLTWLELYSERDVLEKLAAPPPEGFGLRVHLSSLWRFEQQARLAARPADLQFAQTLARSPEDLDRLRRGAATSLAQSALRLAASFDPTRVSAGAKLLAALNRDDFRGQELELERVRLDLERQKLAALLALKEAQIENDLAAPHVQRAIHQLLDRGSVAPSASVPSHLPPDSPDASDLTPASEVQPPDQP